MADNLAALTQIAPITGAYMIGQQNASNLAQADATRQDTLQDILAKQQKYGFDEQNNPLLLDKMRLGNTGLGLDNDTKELTNTKTRGTLKSDIDATNSKNQLQTTKDHIAQAQAFEDRLAEVASALPNIPPPMRGAYMNQALSAAGMDVNHPAVQQFGNQLASNPAAIAAVLDDAKRHRMEMTEDYYKTIKHQELTNKGHLEATALQGANALAVENARIEAGKYDKKAVASAEQLIEGAKSARERYSKLVDEATKAKLAGKPELEASYMARAEAVRPQAEAEIKMATPGSVAVGGVTGLPTNPNPQIAPPAAGASAPANPAAPKIGSVADLQKMYPGVPPEKLKELYKKKFGVDLK